MFEESFRGLADLVLPGTSYLERDGTTVNLEGRLQRQRRAVIAPCPDELAWIAKLAERFGVELSPHAAVVFEEVSAACFGGISLRRHRRARRRFRRRPRAAAGPRRPPATPATPLGKGLRLVTYSPLFSGAAVERTPELEFQRPAAEVELSPPTRGHGGSPTARRHRLARTGRRGAPRPDRARPRGRHRPRPAGHAADLHAYVEVSEVSSTSPGGSP